MQYKYAYQGEDEVARAVAKAVPISNKAAVMLADFIRHKTVARARRDLSDVLSQKQAVPFTRFSEGAGHKPGIGPGKYPQKATKAFLSLVEAVAANAQDRGLGDDLVIVHVATHKGARNPRYSRHRGRLSKSAHIEIVVKPADGAKPQQAKKAAKSAKSAKQVKPAETEQADKKESKPQQAKDEPEPKPEPAEKKASEGKKAPASEETKKQDTTASDKSKETSK